MKDYETLVDMPSQHLDLKNLVQNGVTSSFPHHVSINVTFLIFVPLKFEDCFFV